MTPDTTQEHPAVQRVVGETQSLVLQSDPLSVTPGVYEARTKVRGIRGGDYSAYFVLIMLDANGAETQRRIRWLNDFSGVQKEYRLIVRILTPVCQVVTGYRVNTEGTRKSECVFEFLDPSLISLIQIGDSTPEESDHIGIYDTKGHLENKTFKFQGRTYTYFLHEYNTTWANERCVEIPIISSLVNTCPPEGVLEVGNVLSHYYPVSHDIVDKYERSPGVTNEDVVDFRPTKRYDLIVSISSLEHVGLDEAPREPGKIIRAIQTLRGALTQTGRIVVTLPIGYNTELDDLLRRGKITFAPLSCLKRISESNDWKEVEWSDISYANYGMPFPFANGLVVGTLRRD